MSRITYQALEEAYMRHTTAYVEPDALYVSHHDFRAIMDLFTDEQLRAARAESGSALRFHGALMYPSLTAADGEMGVYRQGELLGTAPIYATVV